MTLDDDRRSLHQETQYNERLVCAIHSQIIKGKISLQLLRKAKKQSENCKWGGGEDIIIRKKLIANMIYLGAKTLTPMGTLGPRKTLEVSTHKKIGTKSQQQIDYYHTYLQLNNGNPSKNCNRFYEHQRQYQNLNANAFAQNISTKYLPQLWPELE